MRDCHGPRLLNGDPLVLSEFGKERISDAFSFKHTRFVVKLFTNLYPLSQIRSKFNENFLCLAEVGYGVALRY